MILKYDTEVSIFPIPVSVGIDNSMLYSYKTMRYWSGSQTNIVVWGRYKYIEHALRVSQQLLLLHSAAIDITAFQFHLYMIN